MGAIVKELKEKIVAAGGDTTGIQTVSEALDKLPSGGRVVWLGVNYDVSTGKVSLDMTAQEILDTCPGTPMFLYQMQEVQVGTFFAVYNLIYAGYETDQPKYLFVFYCLTDSMPNEHPSSVKFICKSLDEKPYMTA